MLGERLGQYPNPNVELSSYNVFVSPQLIKLVVERCLVGCFTPASLRACIAEELRIPLEYREVYNFIRRLTRKGLIMREGNCYKPREKLYELLMVNDDKVLRLLQWIMARRPPWRGSAFGYTFLRVLLRAHVRGSLRFVDYMALRFVVRLVQGVVRSLRGELKNAGWSESELRRIDSFVAWCVKCAKLLDVYCDGHGRKGLGENQPLGDVRGSEEHGCDSVLEVPDACELLLRFVKVYFRVIEVVEDGGCRE